MALTQEAYEKRFKQRFDGGEPNNAIGYGKDKPFRPPIEKQKSLLGVIDKSYVT